MEPAREPALASWAGEEEEQDNSEIAAISLGYLQLTRKICRTPLALSTTMQRPKPEVEHLPDLSKPRRSPAKRTTPQRIARDGTAATAPGEWNARVQFWDRAIPEYNALTDPNARVFTNSATFRRDYKSLSLIHI